MRHWKLVAASIAVLAGIAGCGGATDSQSQPASPRPTHSSVTQTSIALTPGGAMVDLADMKVGDSAMASGDVVAVDKSQHCWIDSPLGYKMSFASDDTVVIKRLEDGYYLQSPNGYKFLVNWSLAESDLQAFHVPVKNCANMDELKPSGTTLDQRYRQHTAGADLKQDGDAWLWEGPAPPNVWIPEDNRAHCFIDPSALINPVRLAAAGDPSNLYLVHVRWDGAQYVILTPHRSTEAQLRYGDRYRDYTMPAVCPLNAQ